MSQGRPKRWVTIMALVRSVIWASMVSAVTLSVSESTSANTGMAPSYRMGVKAPMSVMGVVMISSPAPGLTAATAQ